MAKSRIWAHSTNLAARFSLFWADADFSAGRFPPLDRIDYLAHAVTLLERRRVQPARPSLLEVRTYLGAEPLASWSRQVARLSTLTELTPEDHKPYLRALLYPARFLCSWEAGTVTSNDDAVAYVGKRGLLGPDTGIVVRALRCRNEGDSPAPLFPERQRLLRLLDICVGRVGAAR